MPENSNLFFSVDINWGIVLSITLFALVLFYFLFFQQYLTALIWRLFVSIFVPKNIQINFKRLIISFISGHVTIFDVTIITEDMEIHIDELDCNLYYWRKNSDFQKEGEKRKTRFEITICGLDITIYNRTWSTNLVESVKAQFEDGKSTDEISQYILNQYPHPSPYQLSFLLRMILPLEFHIYACSLKIGNPTMPAFLIFRAESISGFYTLVPRKSTAHSIQSFLNLDILTFSLKSLPCTINETEWFKKSMRNIYNRSHSRYQIIKAEYVEIRILTDRYGLYILPTEENLINQVTQQPQMIIDVFFRKRSTIYYGPYIDKLRRVFMDYFAPFLYNDAIIYPDARKRIKQWVVNLLFPDGATLKMPFEMDRDDLIDPDDEKRKGCLLLHVGKESNCQMFIPQYIDIIDDNKFELNSTFKNVSISTSIPGQIPKKAGPPIIHAPTMKLSVGYFYPERWNEKTIMNILVNFEGAVVVLTPYHIDYLAQFGTDFSSYYPFMDGEETLDKFCPYAYYLTVSFNESIFKLFTEPYPRYECFYDPDQFPQAEILATKFLFKLSLPLVNYNEQQKQVSFSAEMHSAKVSFYLPDNHLMRIRRGPQKKFIYDFVLMDRFVLIGSYHWSADEHGDCQIPVNILISNVEGVITIGTLVTLIGTIANYTSRERQHPKIWNDPPQKDIFKYINNTNVRISIERGTVKVPLDLYEPNAGAIAHASGILIGVEGYHPFWHALVDINCAVVELPRTDFPYDRYFNQKIQSDNGPKEGTFHVEYIHITMKTISTFTGYNFVELHTKIGCEIGNIDGFALMPQLFCGLEIAWNIIHSFFGDDVSKIRKFDPFYIYKVEVFRICIGSIRVYLDMGDIGLVLAMLPGGVVVYSDTLIDENAHYVIFVHLPSIDAHIIQYSQEEERVHCIFRASTYLNVVRDIKFDNGKEDQLRQNQLLRMYDVLPHPERFIGGTKRNYFTYLFDFINKDKSQLSSEYFYIPEMMRPETYHSSLYEEYEIESIKVTDPRNDSDTVNKYTLPIPEVRYPSYKKFINMEDGIQWLHHYETVRFYNHLSPSRRNMFNIPPADPKLFATRYYEEDKFRARNSNGAIRLVLPNTVIVQLLPTALINASALLNAFNLFPNEELLAKVVRSTVGDEFDLKNYHSTTINVILPQVKVLIHGDSYGIGLAVNNVNIRSVTTLTKTLIKDAPEGKDKKVKVDFDKNLTLYIKSVSLDCFDPKNEKPSIAALVPDICLVKVNDKGSVKISPIKLYFGSDSPSLLNNILKTLPKYLEDLSVPTIGDRCDELVRIIKASPTYNLNLKELMKTMYSPGECNTRFKVNCELSALYKTLRDIKLVDYTEKYMFQQIPPKPPSNGHSLMTLNLPIIGLSIQTSSSLHHIHLTEPTLLLDFAPLVIENDKDETFITGGIKSLKISLTTEIIRFIKNVIPTSSPSKKSKKKNLKKNLKGSLKGSLKKSLKKSRKNSDLLNDYEYSSDINTVAKQNNVYVETENNDDDDDYEYYEYEEDDDEENNEVEVLKPSDIFQKPKEKPSDSKIFAHFVVDSINIGFNQLLVKLENISLLANVQLSHITNSSLTASFNDFNISVNEWVSIILNGVSLTHNGDLGEGFVHVKPIAIYADLDFIMNPTKYVDLTFIGEIFGDMNNDDDVGDENNDMNDGLFSSRIPGNDIQFDPIRSYKSKVNSNTSSNPISKSEVIDFLKQVSTSLLIDTLSVIITVSSKSQLKLIFPKALGFMFSSEETIHALCYFQKAQFSAGHYFSFPFPNFIFNLKMKPEFIDALLMVGDIDIIGQSKQLSNVASLVNEILSTFEKPKSENQNNTSITSTSSTPISSPISPRRNTFSTKNRVKTKSEVPPISINSESTNATNTANASNSKFKLLFTFHLLKIEVKVDELSTSLVLNQTLAEVRSKNSILTWGFNVVEIKGKVFDSLLSTSICGKKSKSKNKLSFTVTPLDLIVSHNLFNKIPLFARFAIVILNGFKKQKHVNLFLHQLNDHIQQQHAENLLNDDDSNKKFDFPVILSNYISFSIQNVNAQLLLPPSGATIVSIPEISLDVKVKNSPLHSKQAIGAKFQIQNFDVVFDTEENLMSNLKVKRKNHLSSFHITQFVVSALTFQNDIDCESIVDGINLTIYPTIPYAIAKLLLSIFALTANATKAKEIFEKNEESNHSSNHLLGSPRSRSRTLSTINVPNRTNNIKNMSPTSRRSISIASKIVTKIITCFFKCKNFEINLSLSDNKLIVPSVELRFMIKNTSRKQKKDNNLSVSLFIPYKIEASFTPELIVFLGSLKNNLSVLSEESMTTRKEQYIEQQKELKKMEKQEKKEKQKKQKEKEKENQKENAVSSTIRSIHNRTKSISSNIDLIDEDEDDIFDSSKKLSYNINIVFYSKDLEICFSCQPRRNDVSVRIGLSSISLVVSTQSKYISAQLVNFFLKTHNIFSMQNDKKTAQLFQFVIPQIDALLSKNKAIVEVEKIISSFSSDKVEEITLFNDIWFQPLLKMINSDEENNENNVVLTGAKSDGKLLNYNNNNENSFNYSNATLNQDDVDVDDDESVKSSKKVFDMEVNVAIKAIELTFNYSTGHGSINLTLRPIYISKTRELIYASINSISVNSDGQLSCIFDIENVYFISEDSNHSLTNVIHLNGIKISMEMAGETFLLFSVSQLNLLCRIKKEDTGDKNTILELSIDTPQIKMTALTIPTIKTLIKTISDPIINGVARATRSEMSLEMNSKNNSIPLSEKSVKTSPAIILNKPKLNPSTFSLPETVKNKLVRHLLFAKLAVVVRDFRVVLLRYVFRDNDAVMLSIDAAMLHLDLKPEGKGMNRNLHFSFLPIALLRLTNNEVAPDATNPKGFPNASANSSSSSSLLNKNSNDNLNKKENDLNKAKTRSILKIPRVDGSLETQQKSVDLPDVTYNFYTEFFGNIEPTLNLTDYEMLGALISYTKANVNLNKGNDEEDENEDNDNINTNTKTDGQSGSIGNQINFGQNSRNNSNNNNNNSNNYNNNSNSSFGSKNKNTSDSNTNSNQKDSNDKEKQNTIKNILKTHYNFTPLNYKFAPSFKVGYGASINPDVTWLLARFGISDEHIIPASLFQFLCIGLENFLSTLTNSMTKANQEEDKKSNT